jgi:type II secretory pathway component GspD/PulD (secretin)
MTLLIKKAACALIVLMVVQVGMDTTVIGKVSSPTVILEKTRQWRHTDFSSIVFQFGGPILFEKPVIEEDEVFIKLKNVTTELASFREYKIFGSWVRLGKEGDDLNVRIGIPEDFLRLDHYILENPYRLAIKFYKKTKPSLSFPEKKGHDVTAAPAPIVAGATIKKSLKTAGQLPVEGLLNFNFYQSDIREILSAFAIKQEINIVMAQDVSGKVSVHLHQVTPDKALDAITLAGGFSYRKHDDVYYVYKPREAADPQAENLQIRIFKLKYAGTDNVQEILQGIQGMRMIKIHEPSKTVIVEDTPENIEKIETIISFWDSVPKQVLIEAKILEVTLTDDMSMGVNWEQILGDVRIGTGGFSSAAAAAAAGVSPVPAAGVGVFANMITAAGSRHQFAAAINALQSKTSINTLSTPKILAIHNEEASVQVGGKQGYKVSVIVEGILTETIEFIDTGTILKITPYINDDGNILLKVEPSITSAVLEEGIPVVKTTEVSTWLLAKNEETVFIGGLIQDAKTKTSKSIPCLGSIPGLGLLFGQRSRDLKKSELIILITPTIFYAKQNQSNEEAIEKTKKMEDLFKKQVVPSNKLFPEMIIEKH